MFSWIICFLKCLLRPRRSNLDGKNDIHDGQTSQSQKLIKESGLCAPKGRGGYGKGLFSVRFYMLISLWNIRRVAPGSDLS